MSNIPNQRKTYMMLSKENAEKFIIEPETHKVLQEFPTTHTTLYQEKGVDKSGFETITTTEVPNVMYTFRFPDAFINSKNPRWVEIHHCKLSCNGSISQEFILHSDIVQRDAYCDHAIMNINETRTKYKKYEYTQQNQYFTIWFTSFTTPKTAVPDKNIEFMCEMMLIY